MGATRNGLRPGRTRLAPPGAAWRLGRERWSRPAAYRPAAAPAASATTPTTNGDRGDDARTARRRGFRNETVLVVGIALLGVILSALVWLPLLNLVAPGG